MISFRVALLLLLFTISAPVHAQNNDDVLPLGDILNQDRGQNDGKPVTAALLANEYYKKCVSTPSVSMMDETREILCACTSANMSKTLTVEEIQSLSRKDYRGRDARSKAIAFAYVPCMEFAVDAKIDNDCRTSKALDRIYVGKSKICKCVKDYYRDFLKGEESFIVMQALKYDPMTTDPLEHHFTRGAYNRQFKNYTKRCVYEFNYARQN